MPAARFLSNRSRNATFVFAILAALHFAVSSLLWSPFIYASFRRDWPPMRFVLGALPAFLLLIWFVVASFAAMRRLRLAVWLLAMGLLASAVIFTYDAATRNWQMHAENYHGKGPQKTFYYFTWWWYDESWFHG